MLLEYTEKNIVPLSSVPTPGWSNEKDLWRLISHKKSNELAFIVFGKLVENYLLYLGLGCPSGWTEFGSQCYLIKGKMNTFEGFYQCKKYGATLPIIKSAEENAFLLRLMEKHGQTRLGMIAPNRDNVFEWLDGTSVKDTFSAWNTGEPNNKGTENCGSLYVSGPKGRWNNDPCTTSLYIVCQMEKEWV